jgi:hypothetical protein
MNTGGPGSGTGGEGITFSHPWCSSPANVIPRLLLGVTPRGRGWEQAGATVRPQPGSLRWVNLSMMVGFGSAHPIVVELSQISTAELVVKLGLPPQITVAKVCLPPRFGVSPVSAKTLKVDGVAVPSSGVVEEGRFLCIVVSRRISGEEPRVISRLA